MPLYRHRPREASCFADETRIADWQTSAYVLPYAVGATFRVSQANCSLPGDGHRGSERCAYDFDMPIGTSFVAVRAGVVVHIETSHVDGQVAATGLDNYIVIRHSGGTHALYGYLTHDGAAIVEGAAGCARADDRAERQHGEHE